MSIVVLVEDNPVDVDLVQLAFARAQDPPTIVVYESAEAALAAPPAELETADVIAIDLALPGMSGQALAAVLHERDIGPTLLLAMSDRHAGILVEDVECGGATAKTLTAEKVDAFLAAREAGEQRVVI